MIGIGKVYKKFSCGHIIPNSTPTHKIYYPQIKTLSGNGKRITACPICRTGEAYFEYRFKVCPECGELRWAKCGNLRPGRCKDCGARAYREMGIEQGPPVPMRYFQNGQEILPPRRPHTEPMCRHRGECLWAASVYSGFLHCGGCKKYQPEQMEMEMGMHRGFDPCYYAEGV